MSAFPTPAVFYSSYSSYISNHLSFSTQPITSSYFPNAPSFYPIPSFFFALSFSLSHHSFSSLIHLASPTPLLSLLEHSYSSLFSSSPYLLFPVSTVLLHLIPSPLAGPPLQPTWMVLTREGRQISTPPPAMLWHTLPMYSNRQKFIEHLARKICKYMYDWWLWKYFCW